MEVHVSFQITVVVVVFSARYITRVELLDLMVVLFFNLNLFILIRG